MHTDILVELLAKSRMTIADGINVIVYGALWWKMNQHNYFIKSSMKEFEKTQEKQIRAYVEKLQKMLKN